MTLKPPVSPNTPLGTGRVFYNVVADFGAWGDNSHEDWQAFQFAANTGSTVYVPDGHYKVTSQITVRAGSKFILARGATIDFSQGASNMILFYGAGTLSDGSSSAPGNLGVGKPGAVVLSADTAIGASSVSVAAGAESTFSAGDWVLIGSSAYYETRTSLYGAGTGQRLGELAQVASTASGSITLKAPLAGGYTDTAGVAQLNYKTSDSAFIQKINLLSGVQIEGGTIVGATGSGSGSQQAVVLSTALKPRVLDVTFQHVGAVAVQFQSCAHPIARDLDADDGWSTGTGYAVAVGDASFGGSVRGVSARNLRHLFTTTSATSSYGVTRRIVVSDCHGYDSVNTGDMFDTHAAAEDIVFTDCHAYGSSEYGFNIECSRAKVLQSTSENSQKEGIYYHNETSAPGRFICSNNEVLRAGLAGVFAGIRYTVANAAGMGTVLGTYMFTGNTVIQPGGVGFQIAGSAGTPFTGVTLMGNTVENPGSTNGAYYLDRLDRPTVTGNIARNLSANCTGIRLGTMTKGTVTGNEIDYLALGTGSGILGATATDCTVGQNTVTNGGKGVNLDNNCASCIVVGNELSGCTTPLSLGTGTGHVNRANKYSTGAGQGRATLVAGTVTVNTAEVQTNENINLTHVGASGTLGTLSVGTIVAGTSFVINSSSGTDTSTIFWEIVH